MSLSKEYQEYHLTPKGWVQGDFKADVLGASEDVPTPPDTVLTLRCYYELTSAYSKPHFYEKKVWESENIDLVETLKKKYGQKPNWFGYKMMK